MNVYASVVFDLDGHPGRFQPRHSRSAQPGPHGSRRARTHRRTGRATARGRGASACRGSHPGLRHTADDAIVEEVIPAYLYAYRRHPVIDSVLFEGVAETLQILSERGLPLGVCTNPGSVHEQERADRAPSSQGPRHLPALRLGGWRRPSHHEQATPTAPPRHLRGVGTGSGQRGLRRRLDDRPAMRPGRRD